jgi:hypothetical protein
MSKSAKRQPKAQQRPQFVPPLRAVPPKVVKSAARAGVAGRRTGKG